MILPDESGKAWDMSGRIAAMWLTLVVAFARGERPRCAACGRAVCRDARACERKRIDLPLPRPCYHCGGAPCKTPRTCHALHRIDRLRRNLPPS